MRLLMFRPTYIGRQVFFLIRYKIDYNLHFHFLSPISYFWALHVTRLHFSFRSKAGLKFGRDKRISCYVIWPTTAQIECFHSGGQHLYKFIRTKESIYKRKEFNSHWTSLEHKHGRSFHCFGAPYGGCDVMCTLYTWLPNQNVKQMALIFFSFPFFQYGKNSRCL